MSDDPNVNDVNDVEITDKVAEALQETPVSDLVTTSTGVVVRVLHIPDSLMMRLFERFPRPKPPKISIPDGVNVREEDNPDDPVYLAALTKYRMDLNEAAIRADILKGIEIVSLPSAIPPFDEDKEWLEELEAMGLGVDQTASRSVRYIEWYLYRIAPQVSDRELISDVRLKTSGMTQEEIARAEATFRG